MNSFDTTKAGLLQVNKEILALFDKARSIPGISRFPFEEWEKVGHSIEEQINEDILRIAVVGAIKSGKSTFINDLLGGDYLKRGAGVVTSIVTRIRKKPQLKAILDFKSWDDVNADMQQAMVLFPSLDWNPTNGQFDVRRDADRKHLEKALKSLSSEKLITQETLDANSVLLTSYLGGYERVKDILYHSTKHLEFVGRDFANHKDFVGNDSLAVYLKDLELHVPGGKNLDDHIEIADCQGIDSLNPFHLAMIQDYLLRTHLIIYLLSSRTGIRQADIKFLSIIKKMGLLENIFFVVNCDFSEHEDLRDLKKVVERVGDEISVIKPKAHLFAYSTLYNLFRQVDHLSEKDVGRREQWRKEEVLAGFSDRERNRFFETFGEKLTRDRYALLLKNHVERVAIMAGGLNDWTRIHHDILIKDTEGARDVLKKIDRAGEQLNQQKTAIKDMLDGTSHKAKREIGKDVDRFLDARFGEAAKDIHNFVSRYTVDYEKNELDIEERGFSTTLYMIFQEFKRALDRFMAETINPRLIEFIRQEERKIGEILNRTAISYDALVQDALQKHEEKLRKVGISSEGYRGAELLSVDLESLKHRTELTAPTLVSTLRYTAKVRTEAIMRLGFYNVLKMMKKLLKKQIQNEQEGEIFALKDGVKRIKQETERSIIFHLRDYKENLKFQYLYRLIDIVSGNLYELMLDRFKVFTSDVSDMAGLVDAEQSRKQEALQILQQMEEGSLKAGDHIALLKKQMEE